jgi:hypothetical protein
MGMVNRYTYLRYIYQNTRKARSVSKTVKESNLTVFRGDFEREPLGPCRAAAPARIQKEPLSRVNRWNNKIIMKGTRRGFVIDVVDRKLNRGKLNLAVINVSLCICLFHNKIETQ